jgi:hypothetical protein
MEKVSAALLAAMGVSDAMVVALSILIGAGYLWIRKRLKQDAIEGKALRDGLKALLRDRIVQAYHYNMDKGYLPVHVRDSVNDLHRQYSALGGNGTITELMGRMQALPFEKKEVEMHVFR